MLLVTPKKVAIIDDVFTTGSTVNELSRELKKAGVEQIEVWCAAKTQKANETISE